MKNANVIVLKVIRCVERSVFASGRGWIAFLAYSR